MVFDIDMVAAGDRACVTSTEWRMPVGHLFDPAEATLRFRFVR